VDPGHVERLGQERTRTLRQIESLQKSFEDIVAASEQVATDDEHDPEGHTIAWERQQVAALLESARQRLAELELAILRVEGGDYGRCEMCGRPIPEERLEAVPTAANCMSCAS
jgi:DnaK suppressor protein